MKNLLKLTNILILSASFFLASCSQDNMIETEAVVTMRNFAQADAGTNVLGKGESEIKSISNKVSDNWKSTVFKMMDGQMVACDDCKIEDFEITQVFLINSQTRTLLYQNGYTTNAAHTFTGEDVIGIDMNYKGEYVRMSDIDVFSQSQDGQYLYADELGVEVFANGSTGTNSAVYYFPILSNQADPGNSLSGMWMRIVLDFN